jgi:hypothetical protein
VNVLIWHVHGSWLTAFVQGRHTYYVPVVPDRGPEGRGRAQTWDWPASVIEVDRERAGELDLDAVIFQRPIEVEEYAPAWLGARRPGRDYAAIYLEHDTPRAAVPETKHPLADRDDFTLVHVTHFNQLFWDAGSTASRVIEHGLIDPGYRYTGELARSAVVINEARRRGRVSGTDLLERFERAAPLDVFGMDARSLGGIEDLPQARLHDEMARRRVYLHPFRWTSLGLSLIEAMLLGMPVVALATTAVPESVPAGAGIVSTDLRVLLAALRALVADAPAAAEMGRRARSYALERFGLDRFLTEWDGLLEDCAP